MLRLTFLGTSGSTPTRAKSLPAVALEYEGEVLLFDCGEGAQRQAILNGVNISKISSIFITHMHGDHMIGIAGLVRTLALNKRQQPLLIYVPRGEEAKVTPLLTFDRALIGYPIIVKGVASGKIYAGDGFTVSAFKLNHTLPTYGYAFAEDTKIRFITDKCKKLGIKGTMFSELSKKGWIRIGKKRISLKDVTFTVPGVKIAYATDTRPCASTVKAAEASDLLIHDASYGTDLKALARDRGHSTSAEAADIAKRAKCKKLMLFHTSARYKDTAGLLKEAKAVFPNSQVAEDGMKITF